MLTTPTDYEIRTRPCPECYLCGTKGQLVYQGLQDRLFGAPGTWDVKRCPGPACGLTWLDPMPLQEDLWKAYKQYYTHESSKGTQIRTERRIGVLEAGYLALQYGYFNTCGNNWKKIVGSLMYLMPSIKSNIDSGVMYLPAKTMGLLLDVGCGNGEAMEYLQRVGWGVEGIDLDPVAIELARSRGLHAHVGSLGTQRFSAEHFDAITLSHVLEHVPDPISFLGDCLRILKPGGTIIVSTPNIESLGHKAYTGHWRGLEPPRHLYIFSHASLQYVAERTGFKVVRIMTTNHWVHGIIAESIKAVRRRTNADSRNYIDKIIIRTFSCVEILGMFMGLNWGEELVMIGRKR